MKVMFVRREERAGEVIKLENELLRVEAINKSYRDLKAVDDVSFEVATGEILGLLGPNGAGKTTIIRMIMGILEPDSGTIFFNNSTGSNLLDKKQMGYLPEERGIYGETKLLQTILYFAELNNYRGSKAREAVHEWLKKLDLVDFKNKKIEELSRGMQQKVQFIISIIHHPRLLVLDELFSGLDPVNQELFKNIVLELSQAGMTILLSSHRMNLVEELCDRIFLINKGRRVLYGDLDSIKESFGRKYVKMVVEPGITPADFTNEQEIGGWQEEENKVQFNIPAQKDIRELLQALPARIDIKEISVSNPPLHNIFVNTVKGGREDA